jgi:glyoxylase-like metal-dependent hydrolase (beta-lactamase superfamily II)
LDNRTEQLARGIWRVEVTTYVNCFVLANDGRGDDEGLTIVDTGTRSGGPRLVRSLRMMGLDPRAVSDVLLTHWHPDHAGSAARFATSGAGSRVWVGDGDPETVRGAAPRVPPSPDTTLPGRLLTRHGKRAPAVPSARGLAEGQRLEVAGGLTVVATPGHTAGHVAYLLTDHGVLLAGDALFNVWFLSRGPRFLCTALSSQRATIEQISHLDFEVLAVAHGPAIGSRARERVAALA